MIESHGGSVEMHIGDAEACVFGMPAAHKDDSGEEAWHPETITPFYRQAVEHSMLSRFRLHDLRHTHATLALQADIHAKVVSERLGHATIAITLDTYWHAVPALQEEAAERIAGLVLVTTGEATARVPSPPAAPAA